ncbi:MAG: hypothetical protein CYG61_07645 [Actinobacteria bacterium]|nr:MAG: hypothetical protein CYG61_07645 [Actinomycetota bacterium]
MNNGVESLVSISLFGFTSPSPKSKNVCQPTNRRGERQPPTRSSGSGLASEEASKMNPKNGVPSGLPAVFAR